MGQTYGGGGLLHLSLGFLDSSLDLRHLVSTGRVPDKIFSSIRVNPQRPGHRCDGTQQRRTFSTTPFFFLGAAVFFVTPVGFAAAFLDAGFLLIAGAVSTCWKTRGLELPVADRVPSRAIVRTDFN